MCVPGDGPGPEGPDGLHRPDGPAQAAAQLRNALDYLNGCDVASLPTDTQAQLLKDLEAAQSRHTAARARVLAAFAAQRGYEDDGLGSTRAWLRWHTGVTAGAAAGAAGWARRLAAHPVIADALATASLSASWARELCGWTGKLPEAARQDADRILVAAAAGGAHLADLAGLAREMYERSHTGGGSPGGGDDDGFDDRYLRLGITFGGAGRAEGDLTPGCAAALAAVLEALGKKTGPEDTRTAAQRRHDALEEACRRLIASGMLPGRAAQPTHINVHMTLAGLRGLTGASQAEATWIAGHATQPGWLTGPDADAAACDATLIPIVTGHLDTAALDQTVDGLINAVLTAFSPHTTGTAAAGRAAGARDSTAGRGPRSCPWAGCPHPGHSPPFLSPEAMTALRERLLYLTATILSGPGGLAAHLRARLTTGLTATPSLPLDIGAPTETIPAHLRRAVTTRHPHCAFPGCHQPASACEIHHILPRSRGGPASLANLIPLCRFHHLIVIHHWGWQITLNPDATTTATSPDGRTLHSHSPPTLAA